MGKKFINPIHEPEKLVVGGLYRVSHVDEIGVQYLFKQEGSRMSVFDFFRVGDYFVVMKQNLCWLGVSRVPFDLWFCRANVPGNIATTKRSLHLEDFLVIQVTDGDEEETPP